MKRGCPLGIQMLQILFLVLFPFVTICAAPAQRDLSPKELLANRLVNGIAASGIRRVVVFDFTGPEGQLIPFGSWLTDEVSKSLAGRNIEVQVVDRSQLGLEMEKQHLSVADLLNRSVRTKISKSLGVDGFVVGSFGPFRDEIGLTFAVWRLDSPSNTDFRYSSMITGKLPLDIEASAHLDIPLQSFRPSDGVFRAGYAGRTIAECDYCPPPKFSAETVWKVKRGTIIADIVVSTEGRVSEIKIVQSPDMELNEATIKAIKGYKFKSAVDPDGNPAAVRMPYEIIIRTK
jgi:TonB family protein